MLRLLACAAAGRARGGWRKTRNLLPCASFSSDTAAAANHDDDQATSTSSAHTTQHSWTPPAAGGRARVLDGRAAASAWAEQLAADAADVTRRIGRPPGLAVVLVGDRPDSLLYVTRKAEACARAGVRCDVHRLPESVGQAQLNAALAAACADAAVDGVLVQLPLPPHLDEEGAMECLDPRKDVDGFHPFNMGRTLMRGRPARFVPATPLGVMQLLRAARVDVAGRAAVCLGDSNVVGTPLSVLLRDAGAAAVTVCHRTSYAEWRHQNNNSGGGSGGTGSSGDAQRAAADACLPRLPGPGDGRAASAAGAPCGASSPTAPPASSGSSSPPTPPPPPPPPPPPMPCFHREQLPAITRTADLLVVAVGQPELVRASWVKPGAVVIDVGINVVAAAAAKGGGGGGCGGPCGWQKQDWTSASLETSSSFAAAGGGGGESAPTGMAQYRVVGDVAFADVSTVASAVTPVPGGVGPMTIAGVLHNTILAARYSAGLLPW